MSIWLELLETAIHCPSPHNVQPWRIKIAGDREAALYIDPTRTLPKEDLTGSFIVLTMGMFIESIALLAKHRGFELNYELSCDLETVAKDLGPQNSGLTSFARLTLSSAEAVTVYDPELFFRRRTSRLSFEDRNISDEAVDALSAIADKFGQGFHVLTDREKISRIMHANTEALFEDLNSADYHDEIVEWFRFTEKQSLEHRDGLDARCMNTSPANYWLVSRFPSLLKLPILRSVMSSVYQHQLGPIPTLGVISARFWEPADALQAGRFLIRFWLETAAQGLYIHPYGNLVTNRNAAEKIMPDLGSDNSWLIFKIGYSAVPPKSLRLPIERVLV